MIGASTDVLIKISILKIYTQLYYSLEDDVTV